MKKANSANNKEIFEFTDLIRKEKQEALRNFNKEAFRSRLIRRIEEKSKTPSSFMFRFRQPVLAVSTVLVLVVMGWIALQIFTPTPYERDTRAIEKTLAQALETHELLVAQDVPPVEPQPGSDDLYEFEWSFKWVVYSVQREDIPDSDIPRIFSQAIQNAIQAKETENNEPSGGNPESKNGISLKENNLSQMLYKAQD